MLILLSSMFPQSLILPSQMLPQTPFRFPLSFLTWGFASVLFLLSAFRPFLQALFPLSLLQSLLPTLFLSRRPATQPFLRCRSRRFPCLYCIHFVFPAFLSYAQFPERPPPQMRRTAYLSTPVLRSAAGRELF